MSTNLKYAKLCKFASQCYAFSSDLISVTCQIPFIAMYRKENCPTLLKSLDSDEGNEDNEDNKDNESDARKMKWHKVINYYYYYSLSTCSSHRTYQLFAITKTNLVFYVVALGSSDLGQKVATSSEAQGCFTVVL